MDKTREDLYFLNMDTQDSAINSVPNYGLYGEETSQSGEFSLHCETISSRSRKYRFEIDVHRHRRFFQFLYIQAGEGDANIEDNQFRLAPGSLVILPPRVKHGFRFSQDIEGLVVTIDAESPAFRAAAHGPLGATLATGDILTLDRTTPDTDFLSILLSNISREFDQRRIGRNELLASMITTALTVAGRLADRQNRSTNPHTPNQRLEMLYQLIDRHFRDHQPAGFYASLLGISAAHLNRMARRETGFSTHELISRRLIDQAQRDLVFTRISVQGIGYDLGFSDPGYFTRFFNERVGMPPSAYRQTERAKLSF